MFCENCKFKIENGTQFCNNCGAQISAQHVATDTNVQMVNNTAMNSSSSNKKRTIKIIIYATLGSIFLSVIVYTIYSIIFVAPTVNDMIDESIKISCCTEARGKWIEDHCEDTGIIQLQYDESVYNRCIEEASLD